MKARTASRQELFRRLPSVDDVLRLPEVAALAEREGHATVTEAARGVLARMRQEIATGGLDAVRLELALAGLPVAIERQLRSAVAPSLRPVINATGVVLHTNLGRAPLAEAAIEHIRQTACRYSNLEFDASAGQRGRRDVHVERLFARLLSTAQSEVATIVVNNNAAAVLVALNTLAEGGEVIVSRGELVEIGGSFRIPEIMAKSGAVLREVGTTNRTRLADYQRALSERTRLILRVHRSNFQIVGFTEQPEVEELADLGRKHRLPMMEDLGSGALLAPSSFGISGEPAVSDSLRAGVEVVTYSGDKLLGGPQAGILSGRPETIARIRRNPLFRALRVDKLTYAALEATLLAYVRQDHNSIPTLRMLQLTAAEIASRAEALAAQIAEQNPRLRTEIVSGESVTGGGSAPAARLPTRLIAVTCEGLSADELAARLRADEPPIVARVEEGRVLLDLRTVFPDEEAQIVEAFRTANSPRTHEDTNKT